MDKKILCIDVGNSRIKWAILQNGVDEFIVQEVCDQLPDLFNELSQLQKMPVFISLVRSDHIKEQLKNWFESNWELLPEFVQSDGQTGDLKNAYLVPEELGVDRWMALLAARNLCKGDFCVIDAGTALTIDMVNRHGQHEGGVILPGVKLMINALNQNTANINVSVGEMMSLANRTEDAVVTGAKNAWLGGVERVVKDLQSRYPGMTVFVTGGDRLELKKLNMKNAIFKSELVLMGVGLVAQKQYA